MEIKFFKKEKSFKKDKENLWLNIDIYWAIALYLMFVVFFISLFFGYNLYTQINKEPILSEDIDASGIKTIKKERIDKLLEYFSKRDIKSQQIINSPAPVIDPSL